MMMIDRHYEDEVLISFLGATDAARDPHLVSCRTCSETLASFRTIADTLGEKAVWDLRELRAEDAAPVASTVANLRAFADTMAREDAQAEAWLPELLAGPRETWMAKLQRHPEYRTPGTVRKLIAATDRAIDTMPPDAVTLTELATDIADHLPPTAHPSDTVAKLRGAAWRERAYALFYVGRFAEAEKAVDIADAHFATCVVDEYDRARVGIVRALVCRARDEDDAAIAAVRRTVELLRQSGDIDRLASAVIMQGQMLLKRNDRQAAWATLLEFEQSYGAKLSADTHARLLGNLGMCERLLRKFADALQHYHAAAAIFEDIGVATESLRSKANIALVLRDAGRTSESIQQFSEAMSEFERLGMAAEVANTGLILSELLLASGDHRQVEIICRRAMRYFETAGVPYSAGALTALAYIREAANEQKVTPELVRHVDKYMRRLPVEPALLFAPLPG